MSTSALHLLQTVFGYAAFRGEQQAVIEHVAGGGDALVLMPTGGGKSLCYQIPALLRPGTRDRRLAADRADAGSGRCAAPARRRGRVPQFEPRCVRAARGRAAFRRRHAQAAVRRARAPADRALPRHARTRRGVAVRDRRGALRLAMGPRFPSGISPADGAARALSERAAHRADRDGRCADAARDRRAARARRSARSSSRASTGRTSATASSRRTRRAASCKDFLAAHAGESGIVYCLSRKKVEETADVAGRAGHRGAAVSRRHGCVRRARPTSSASCARTAS